MKKYARFLFFILAVAALSCRKHVDDRPGTSGTHAADTNWLAAINRQVAAVLETVYRNDTAYREVNAAIKSGYYADERVLLKDLLTPETSGLYLTHGFRQFQVPPGVFKRVFSTVLRQAGFALLRDAVTASLQKAVVAETSVAVNSVSVPAGDILSGPTAVAIYFPYSVNFGTQVAGIPGGLDIAPATIVAAERDGDAAPGRAPRTCGLSVCHQDVWVDDGYADSTPTHIVENGARPQLPPMSYRDTGQAITRVYLGWARLTRQMDALISFTGNGGGSEIKVARISAYLKEDGQQVTSFSGDVVTLDFSRSDIRNQVWKRVYSIWDPDWEIDNSEQVYAVYEDDTKGTKTFSGTLSASANLPGKPSAGKATGEITYKVEVSTQDEIITQRKLGRDAFLRDGMNNQGWGFMADPGDFLPYARNWPVYDGGTIWQYSMPWKIS